MSLVRKLVIAAAVFAVLGVLFMRSLQSTRSAPYTVEAARVQTWTLVLEPSTSPTAPLLGARTSQELVSGLFRQVFTRMMESLNAPAAATIPIVLNGEFQSALGAVMTPDALLDAARAAGLEAAVYEPRCVAHRRVSQPGGTRQVYFATFESPAFERFRGGLAERLGAAGVAADAFDPRALSPIMFIASADPVFERWLPVRVDPDVDCIAPIEIG